MSLNKNFVFGHWFSGIEDLKNVSLIEKLLAPPHKLPKLQFIQ